MKRIYFLVVIFITSFQSHAAKKECVELLNKYHNVQSQQRQGSSFKRSISLRKKEDAARQKWWACENNKLKPKAKSKNKITKKKYKKKTIKLVNNSNKTIKKTPRVFSSNNIVIKGRFVGDKQLQWLSFYKRPKECAKPKTTQVFAFCMEDKMTQQDAFEQQFKEN
jgi:hypothetical protein